MLHNSFVTYLATLYKGAIPLGLVSLQYCSCMGRSEYLILEGWEFFYLLAPSQIVTTKGSKWAGCYEIVWRQIGMF
jgi:hypothetical protein